MGSFGGFLTGFSEAGQAAEAERRAGEAKVRDLKADELEQAIKGIQSDTKLSPEEKAYRIGEAHKQLTGLYQPHEGPDLLKRLRKLAGHKEKTATPSAAVPTGEIKVGDATIPSETKHVQLRPGMTLEEVLAGTSTQQTFKTLDKPTRGADGKWYVTQEDAQGNISRKEVPGYSVESRKQELIRDGYTEEEAEKIMRIEGGIEAKVTAAHKGMKYDAATDEVVDQDSGDRYSRDDLNKKETPEVVRHMFEGATRTQDKKQTDKEQFALRRFNERLQLQRNAIAARFDAGDYVGGRRELNKVKAELVAAQSRMDTMDENATDALNGNQQAMLSLVANHIGMTLGAQKGARITRAVWDEAMQSAQWLDTKIARFFHVDPQTGDRTLLEPLSGVVLTPDQIKQMTQLAHQKVDILQKTVKNTETTFKSELSKGHGTPDKPIPDKPTAAAPKKKVSLKAAMALPINKGKNEAEVRKDIEAHGYEVAP